MSLRDMNQRTHVENTCFDCGGWIEKFVRVSVESRRFCVYCPAIIEVLPVCGVSMSTGGAMQEDNSCKCSPCYDRRRYGYSCAETMPPFLLCEGLWQCDCGHA